MVVSVPSIFKSLQIVVYDFISSIEYGHFLIPLTGPSKMKTASVAFGASRIDKIITMIGDLRQKIIKERQDVHGVYTELAEWCEESTKTVMFVIKTWRQPWRRSLQTLLCCKVRILFSQLRKAEGRGRHPLGKACGAYLRTGWDGQDP